jgi:hypothetical protein
MRQIERYENISYPYIFRKAVPAGDSGFIEAELTGHGYVTEVTVNFAAGENGTLHLRPYVIVTGEITQELLRYAGDPYISGDDCQYRLPCYQEIENHAMLRVWYENTAPAGTADSQIMVDVIVQYDSYAEPKNVIG